MTADDMHIKIPDFYDHYDYKDMENTNTYTVLYKEKIHKMNDEINRRK